MTTTGEAINRYLNILGMTQAELAQSCGVSPKTVWTWVADENAPKLPHARKIAETFGCSIDELAGLGPWDDSRLGGIVGIYNSLNEEGREYLRRSANGAAAMDEFRK